MVPGFCVVECCCSGDCGTSCVSCIPVGKSDCICGATVCFCRPPFSLKNVDTPESYFLLCPPASLRLLESCLQKDV